MGNGNQMRILMTEVSPSAWRVLESGLRRMSSLRRTEGTSLSPPFALAKENGIHRGREGRMHAEFRMEEGSAIQKVTHINLLPTHPRIIVNKTNGAHLIPVFVML